MGGRGGRGVPWVTGASGSVTQGCALARQGCVSATGRALGRRACQTSQEAPASPRWPRVRPGVRCCGPMVSGRCRAHVLGAPARCGLAPFAAPPSPLTVTYTPLGHLGMRWHQAGMCPQATGSRGGGGCDTARFSGPSAEVGPRPSPRHGKPALVFSPAPPLSPPWALALQGPGPRHMPAGEPRPGHGRHPWVAPCPGQSHDHEGAELPASRPLVSVGCFQTGWLGVWEA